MKTANYREMYGRKHVITYFQTIVKYTDVLYLSLIIFLSLNIRIFYILLTSTIVECTDKGPLSRDAMHRVSTQNALCQLS